MKRIITKYKFLLMTITVFFAGTIAAGAQKWIEVASMAEVRNRHSATLLLNGKVLVNGGFGDFNHSLLGRCELYDPVANTWSPAPSMEDRILPTTTLLFNGKVLVTGGFSGSCELYDPIANTWSPAASMGIIHGSRHTATRLFNGKVLVTGGRLDQFVSISSCELYDPVSDTWSSAGSMAVGRSVHTATLLLNGKVLVVGGHTNNTDEDVCELYDPVTNTWSTVAPFPLAGHNYHNRATLLLNGKVLVSGGNVNEVGNTGGGTNSCVLYDPTTNIWSTTGSMASIRYRHTATLLSDGKVMVAGGAFYLSSCELYDPETGTWKATAEMTGSRINHTATPLSDGKVLVVGGGLQVLNNLASCELYTGAVHVSICHKTGNATNPCQTMNVARSAVQEHLDHGDFLGNCTTDCVASGSFEKSIKPEKSDEFKVVAYPNPSSHQFTLSLEGGSYQKTEVMVYDILGRLVNHIEADALPILLGKELTAGHYFAIVKQGNNQQTVRLIKRQ